MRSALAGIDLQWCRVVRGTFVEGQIETAWELRRAGKDGWAVERITKAIAMGKQRLYTRSSRTSTLEMTGALN